jgi:BolA protein
VSTDRVKQIQDRLEAAFSPSHLQVKDQSHLHAGHAGARDGRGHFEVTIVADAFAERGRIERHRLVYEALGQMMQTDIHALKINAFSPTER